MSTETNQVDGQATTDTVTTTDAADTSTSTTLLDDPTAADAANADGKNADSETTTGNGDGKTETSDGDKSKDDADRVPDQYEDFTMPDGVEMQAEVSGEFKALAKEFGLSQAKAQKVADLGAKLVQNFTAQQAEAVAAEQANWANASRSDKEFGGDNLKANLGIAKAALEKFGTPELKTLLNESALGNHPEVIRLLHRVGKAVSEDTSSVRGGATAPAPSATSMYPNSKMN